jgi:hypothetical protein
MAAESEESLTTARALRAWEGLRKKYLLGATGEREVEARDWDSMSSIGATAEREVDARGWDSVSSMLRTTSESGRVILRAWRSSKLVTITGTSAVRRRAGSAPSITWRGTGNWSR